MATLLAIKGWIFFVISAGLATFTGALVVSTVGELLQKHLHEGNLSSSPSMQESA